MPIGDARRRVQEGIGMTIRRVSLWTAACSVILATGLSAGGRDYDRHGQTADDRTDAKIIFVLYCRSDITHQECMARWNDRQHTRLVKRIPHLEAHVRNVVTQLPFAGATDGLGELWFPSVDDMNEALSSPEFNAAFLDAQRFLDLGRTYAVVVDEILVIDRAGHLRGR
jgi:uncharacterized protein (TIGR02118 family)